jgi:hypothetical protein
MTIKDLIVDVNVKNTKANNIKGALTYFLSAEAALRTAVANYDLHKKNLEEEIAFWERHDKRAEALVRVVEEVA